jgi:tRNA1Val (adenine37-N6)-methyltransferase
MARKVVLDDPVLGPLTDDRLTRDVRVYQRQKGHRFSSDDVVTAYVAYHARPEARTVLDLGCGLGSVLLHLAWKLPQARLSGVEAQAVSFELLQRNLARSGFARRVQVHHGDLRDAGLISALGGPFELITGTPPYFSPDAALEAEDEQRAYARIEYRGGVDAYIAAAAPLLTETGALVLCGDARVGDRATLAARAHGVSIRARCDVISRAQNSPLFSVWTLCREQGATLVSSMTLRGPAGEPTIDAAALREFSGFERMIS